MLLAYGNPTQQSHQQDRRHDTFKTVPVDFMTAIVVATSSFGTFACAADLGSLPSQAPVQTWTGFSLGVGGGIGSLNADVNSKASRTDGVGCAPNSNGCPPDVDLREIDQDYNSHFSDLGGTGGFFTLQGAYDYQFAPRWVGGAFVDADWSNISANAKQTNNSSVSFVCPSERLYGPTKRFFLYPAMARSAPRSAPIGMCPSAGVLVGWQTRIRFSISSPPIPMPISAMRGSMSISPIRVT